MSEPQSGRCTCDCGQSCPLGRMGIEYRCTANELRDALLKTQEDNAALSAEVDRLTEQVGNERALRISAESVERAGMFGGRALRAV